jgi:hypothetical protein
VPEQGEGIFRELRSAARFPLHLPLILLSDEKRLEAETVNISANGVLLRVPLPSEVGAGLEFLLEVPQEVLGSGATAAMHCVGHVIRSYEQDGFRYLAAIIDEYRFQ